MTMIRHNVVIKNVTRLLTVIFGILVLTLNFPSSGATANFIATAMTTLKESAEVNIALKDIDISLADKNIALATYLPQLTLKAEVGSAREEYEDDLHTYDELSTRVALSQELIDMSRIYKIKGAGQRVDEAKSNLIKIRQKVLLELAIKWGDYWKALRQQDVNRENIKILKAYLNAATSRYEAGELTITDVRLAESRYQTALSQKMRFLREGRSTREALEERITLAPPEDVSLFAMDVEKIEFPEIEGVVQDHPSMIPLQIEMLGLEEDIKQERAGHWPTLKTVARYKYQYDGEEDSSRYPYNESYIGLELSVPIYSGGDTSNQVKKTIFEKSQQLQKISELRRELYRDIKTAKSDFEQGAEEVEISRKRLGYAEETLKWMTEEFNVGTRTSVDVFLTQSDMINSKLDLIATQEQYTRFAFRYLYSMGILNINTLKQYQTM